MLNTDSIDTNISPTIKSAAIIGAGLLGRLLAWRLSSQGVAVKLYERTPIDQPRSAAFTAAAMISPMSEVVVSERLIFDYGMRSLAIWPGWLQQLNQTTLSPVSYSANGSIVLAHPNDFSELEQFSQELTYHLGKDNPAYWLDKQTLAEKEPDVASQFETGLFLPQEAFLDNRALLAQLLVACRANGCDIIDNTDVNLSDIQDGKDERFKNAEMVLDCRGMGAGIDQQNLRGVRGEVLWVQTKEVQLKHAIRLMHPRYKIYIVPKPNNTFIIGATEIESSDASPMSVQSMLELCSALYTVNPAFSEARILETDANLRPSYFDNLPKIEKHQSVLQQEIISINGLYRHGYLLAPALIEMLYQQHLNENNDLKNTIEKPRQTTTQKLA